ncbi:MAG: hypothetical protein RIF33_17835 [Cyclobacteriaceae bacterium]
MNLVEMIINEYLSDEENTDRSSQDLLGYYINATPSIREAVNKVTRCLTGYNLDSLARFLGETEIDDNAYPSSFKDWFDKHLKDDAQSIAQYGADQGYAGITYTADCVRLYEHYEEDIFSMLRTDAEEMGYSNIFELMGSFNRSGDSDTPSSFKNLLVWYAVERMAGRSAPDPWE